MAVMLCWVLACPLPAQEATQNNPAMADPRGMVKPDAKRAKKLLELAEKSEAAGEYEVALATYQEAARYAPFDVTIVSKAAALRAKLVREHWDKAEKAAIDSNLDTATREMAAALSLDPSNKNVLERLQQMQAMKDQSKDWPLQPRPEGLPKLAPERVTRTFNLHGDIRTVFEQVAMGFGIKATFDPDLPNRTVKLELPNVDFETVMKVLSTETGTFWRVLNSKLIFVAADTTEKRKAYDEEVEQTFQLPASATSQDVTEVVRVLREMTGATKLQQDQAAHTVSIRDTVPRVQLAGEIVKDLERTRGEVLLDIEVLEVDRSLARQYGITPPSTLTAYEVPPNLISALTTAPSLTALLTVLTTIFGTSGATSVGSAIPPIIAIGGGKSTFLLSLPSAAANFSDSLSLVHSGRQVLMRAQDGKPATFFVGERYPITLSLLSGSLGSASSGTLSVGGGAASLIPSEQFTVGQAPVSMVTADFRTIGSNDLAVLNEIDNTIDILLNQGEGATEQFALATNSPISLGAARTAAPAIPAALAVGSINSNTDSLPDLLVTDPVNNTVTELLQNSSADGEFTIQANPIAVGHEPSAMVIGTFNQNVNGNNGFVVTNFADNTYSVFAGNGDGTFSQVSGSPFPLATGETGPVAITTGDFNQDGIPDLAIVNQGTNNVTVLKGNGNGTFTEFTGSPLKVGNVPVAIAEGLLAGSTGPGLAIVNQKDQTVTVYLGNGDGTFAAASQSPLATDTTPTGVVIEDFLEQSLGGIGITNTGANTVTVYVDVGSGLFTEALEPSAGTSPYAIVSADFASGTYPDIAVTNNLSGTAGEVTLLISPTSLISNSSISQTPYPGSEYQDIGLKIKATPTVHANKEVTLQMEFEISALGAASVNGIPVITNRKATQTVRLKEDETSILTGIVDQEETKALSGIPGLSSIPGLSQVLANHTIDKSDTELLILITPRNMRMPDHLSRTIYAGRGDPGGRSGAGPGSGEPPPSRGEGARPEGQAPRGENPPENQPTEGQPPAGGAPPAQSTPPGSENPQQPQPAPPPQPGQPPAAGQPGQPPQQQPGEPGQSSPQP
jgi:Flp pilus assembly secretin CpaC